MTRKIIEKSILIVAPVSVVWENLCQLGQWHRWNSTILNVELLETPKVDAMGKVVARRGGNYRFKLTRVSPGSQLQLERPFKLGTRLIQTFVLIKNAEGVILSFDLACVGRFERAVTLVSRRKLIRDVEKLGEELKVWCENPATATASPPVQLAA